MGLYFSIIQPMYVWVQNTVCLHYVCCEVCESWLSHVVLYGCICSSCVAFYDDADMPFAV